MGLPSTLDLSYGLMPTAARKAWLGQNASGEPEAEELVADLDLEATRSVLQRRSGHPRSAHSAHRISPVNSPVLLDASWEKVSG